MVVSALDTETGRKVAIKKIHDIFSSLEDAKRIVREVRILRSLHHPHIIRLRDAVPPDETGHLSDVYLVTDLMPTDLHRVIYSRQELTLGNAQICSRRQTDLAPHHQRLLMGFWLHCCFRAPPLHHLPSGVRHRVPAQRGHFAQRFEAFQRADQRGTPCSAHACVFL